MNHNNLQNRIKRAWRKGREARLNGKPYTVNPFNNYTGIDGDGYWIQQAFLQGWQECDEELTSAA